MTFRRSRESRVQRGAACLTLPSDPWALWGGVCVTGGAGVGAQRDGWCTVACFAEVRVLQCAARTSHRGVRSVLVRCGRFVR